MPMSRPSTLYPGVPQLPFFSAEVWTEAGRLTLSFKLLVGPYLLGSKQNKLGPPSCQVSGLWFLLVSGPLSSIYEGSNPDLVPKQEADLTRSIPFILLLVLASRKANSSPFP